MCSTATLAPPRHLGFSDVSHDSARVFWDSLPRPVRLFRVSFVSSDGSHSGQVSAALPGGHWGARHPTGTAQAPHPTFTAGGCLAWHGAQRAALTIPVLGGWSAGLGDTQA